MVYIIRGTSYTKFVIFSGGIIAASARLYDYHTKDFDWVLISNVDTLKPFRKMGYGTRIMTQAYKYVQEIFEGKVGVYLLVKEDNVDDIAFYRKLDYKTVKTYKIDKIGYYVMAKGNADINQLKKANFGG